jgi:hypothetical protein
VIEEVHSTDVQAHPAGVHGATGAIPVVTGSVFFRALWGAVFLGGLGRKLSWFTLLELLGAPAFICWQARVVEAFRP